MSSFELLPSLNVSLDLSFLCFCLLICFFYCPFRICWLWWVIPSSTSSCFPTQKKTCLFSLQQPGGLSLAQRVPFICTRLFPRGHCMSILTILSIWNLPFVWMLTRWNPLEPVCDHFLKVFPPLSPSPLLSSFLVPVHLMVWRVQGVFTCPSWRLRQWTEMSLLVQPFYN